MPSDVIKTATPDSGRPWMPDRLYRALQAYVTFIRGLFRANEPGKWRWVENENESEIIVTARAPLTLQANERRPAIVVVRKPAQWANMSLDGVQQQSMVRPHKRFTDMISSAMVVHCLGREGEIANQVAWIIFQAIPIFQRLLHTEGQLHAVTRKLQMGEETDPGQIIQGDALPRWIDVPVTSPFYIQHTTDVEQRADSDFQTVLNTIKMTMETSMPRVEPPSTAGAKYGGPVVDVSRELPDGTQFSLNPPMWKGRPLRGVEPETRHSSQRTEQIQVEVDVSPD